MKYGLFDVRWNRILIPIYLAIRQKCSLICLVVTVRHRNMAFLQIEKKTGLANGIKCSLWKIRRQLIVQKQQRSGTKIADPRSYFQSGQGFGWTFIRLKTPKQMQS